MAARCGPGYLLELREDEHLERLVRDWNFKCSQDFIFRKSRSTIHFPSSSSKGGFHLLVVFRHYTFRLSESSVRLALHVALRGLSAGFHMKFLTDQHFHFSVALRHVGFAVCDLNRITTEYFDVYFHLWRDGGADWFREWEKWQREEDASWHHVVSKRNHVPASNKHVSFAPKLVQDSPLAKSFLKELQDKIRIGDFSCDVPSREETFRFPTHAQDHSSNFKYHQSNLVQVKMVFGCLKE
jgi:hypothetical protein